MAKTLTADELRVEITRTEAEIAALPATRKGPKIQRLRSLAAKLDAIGETVETASQADREDVLDAIGGILDGSLSEIEARERAGIAEPVDPAADGMTTADGEPTWLSGDAAVDHGVDATARAYVPADTIDELVPQRGGERGRAARQDVAPRAGRWSRVFRVDLTRKGTFYFRANVCADSPEDAVARARAAVAAAGRFSAEDVAAMRSWAGERKGAVLLP